MRFLEIGVNPVCFRHIVKRDRFNSAKLSFKSNTHSFDLLLTEPSTQPAIYLNQIYSRNDRRSQILPDKVPARFF